MALDDVKVGRFEARLTDAATYTYSLKIDVVDTAADLASRSDDWTTDPKEVNMRLTFGGSKKWENGNWQSKSFAGYGASDAFLISASDGTKKKKKGWTNFIPTPYPPPPSGIPAGGGTDASSVFANVTLSLNDENSSANEYTLAVELDGGAPVKLQFGENTDVPGSRVIVAITGLVDSSTTMVVDFDELALERQGVAMFVVDAANISNGQFSKNTKDGMVYFKANV